MPVKANKSGVRPSTAKPKAAGGLENEAPNKQLVQKNATNIGETFKALKPEVQSTLDKIFSQVELVSNTLNLLEKRIAYSEDRMFEVLNYIKDHDVSVRPKLVPNYPTFIPSMLGHNQPGNGPLHEVSEPGYIIRPHLENLGGSVAGTHDSYPSPMETNNYRIAEGLKTNEAGEDFFRSTNVFSQGHKY